MKIVKTYVTDDGTSFDNKEEALKHEEELNKEKVFCLEVSESHCYCVNVKARYEDEAIELFYKNPDFYAKYDYEISTEYIEANERVDE